MKCLNLFSGKNKKNVTSLSSAELAQRVRVIINFPNISHPTVHGPVLITYETAD